MQLRLATFMLLVAALCQAQGGVNAYRTVTQSAPASDVTITENTTILYHQISFVKTGTVSACTVAIDSSADGTTWTAGGIIAGTTCTSNGSSAVTSANAKYVRITSTALSGGGSVQFFYKGWTYNPTPGTGSVTSITCGTGLTCTPGSPITTSGTINASSSTANCTVVTFSATPTFDASGNVSCFQITLTGSVPSSTY